MQGHFGAVGLMIRAQPLGRIRGGNTPLIGIALSLGSLALAAVLPSSSWSVKSMIYPYRRYLFSFLSAIPHQEWPGGQHLQSTGNGHVQLRVDEVTVAARLATYPEETKKRPAMTDKRPAHQPVIARLGY